MVNFVQDNDLGYKILPKKFPGIDKFGFRNTDINPNNVNIFSIGDSQTYGVNAENGQNWPALLSKETNQPIYNYGIGGYGLKQYFHLLDRTAKVINWIINNRIISLK